ncbi:hypothetical protein [Streptosporangium sp. NPDC000396]|uniref:Rv1733c family protein n=1 Tax=Streptosporangium sp. NPDC000396 TaxID=3366185 RepID=UPI00369B864F
MPSGWWDKTFVAIAAFSFVVSCAVGFTAYRALSRDVDTYLASHRQVTAEVLDDHRGVPKGFIVKVAWFDERGMRHSGTARLPSAQAPGERTRIWVGPDDKPAPPPLGTPEILAGSSIIGLMAGGVSSVIILLLQAARGVWIARRAMARWDQEWRRYADVEGDSQR